MVKKVKPQKDDARLPAQSSQGVMEGNPAREAARQEAAIKAKTIQGEMKVHGRLRDTKTRERLARNLGRILAERKKRLNLSDLVVNAGISKNDDPNRLGRFRILPGREVSEAMVQRLNQDPLAYRRIVNEVSKATKENPDYLLLDLVTGTRFEGAELAELSIEPYEQLVELIQKKIEALDAKYDLNGYFRAAINNYLLPMWDSGPFCYGRRTRHHAYDRSVLNGWEVDWIPFNYPDSSVNQIMPCVPLCRVRQRSKRSIPRIKANVIMRGERFEDVPLEIYVRIYLAVGINFDALLPWGDADEIAGYPRPYLITASEFHLQNFPIYDINGVLIDRMFELDFGPFSGGVRNKRQPSYFFDPSSGVEIESVEDHSLLEPADSSITKERFGCGYLRYLETCSPITLPSAREAFGILSDRVECLGEDELRFTNLEPTLSPRHTLAELLEGNLIRTNDQEDEADQAVKPNFLDALEADVERMTSNLHAWLHQNEVDLKERHVALMTDFQREVEEAKERGSFHDWSEFNRDQTIFGKNE